mmetsp:Transcript_23257/g.32736  ORF Transcript_23257/g.32736 Transcript_23257/m.32736 type:complete len:182 (-) Transcript_23257:138-683(-)
MLGKKYLEIAFLLFFHHLLFQVVAQQRPMGSSNEGTSSSSALHIHNQRRLTQQQLRSNVHNEKRIMSTTSQAGDPLEKVEEDGQMIKDHYGNFHYRPRNRLNITKRDEKIDANENFRVNIPTSQSNSTTSEEEELSMIKEDEINLRGGSVAVAAAIVLDCSACKYYGWWWSQHPSCCRQSF